MIDLNATVDVIGLIAFALWALLFAFGNFKKQTIKAFFILLGVWVSIGIFHLTGAALPSFTILEIAGPPSLGTDTMLSGIAGVLIISLIVGLLHIITRRKKQEVVDDPADIGEVG